MLQAGRYAQLEGALVLQAEEEARAAGVALPPGAPPQLVVYPPRLLRSTQRSCALKGAALVHSSMQALCPCISSAEALASSDSLYCQVSNSSQLSEAVSQPVHECSTLHMEAAGRRGQLSHGALCRRRAGRPSFTTSAFSASVTALYSASSLCRHSYTASCTAPAVTSMQPRHAHAKALSAGHAQHCRRVRLATTCWTAHVVQEACAMWQPGGACGGRQQPGRRAPGRPRAAWR